MKKIVFLLLTCLILTGCEGTNRELDSVMAFRAKLLSGMGCSFHVRITADYRDEIHTFTMDCRANEHGSLSFTVTQPETIAGITGTISAEGGKLTFDEKALAFDTLADGQVSPVTSPWLLVKTLRGGYIRSCGKADNRVRVSIDDTYRENAMRLDVWFNEQNVPVYSEIQWDNRRILSLEIENFEIL